MPRRVDRGSKSTTFRRQKEFYATHSDQGFPLFEQLLPEIKIEIFQYMPFMEWVVCLSHVCHEWSDLICAAKVPKKLQIKEMPDPRDEITYSLPTSTIFNTMSKFQVTELDLTGLTFELRRTTPWTSVLSASKSLISLILDSDNDILDRISMEELTSDVACTVKNLSVDSLDIKKAAKLFPNLQSLIVRQLNISENDTKFMNLRSIQAKFIWAPVDPLIKTIDRLKEMVPNLENLYIISLGESEIDAKDDIIAKFYSPWQNYCQKLNIKLSCDLFPLLSDPQALERQFKANGRPYGFYCHAGNTLLGEAVVRRELPTIKFLLENNYTTLEDEVGPFPLPDRFERSIDDVVHGVTVHPFLLDSALLYDNVSIIEYLFSKGLDISKKVNGRSFLECYKSVNGKPILYVARNYAIDFSCRTSDGSTGMHMLADDGAIKLLEIALDKIPLEEIRRLFTLQDAFGETPLHSIVCQSPPLLAAVAPLGVDFSIKNYKNESPLMKFLHSDSPYLEDEDHLLEVLPAFDCIEEGIVSLIFKRTKLTEDTLLKVIQLLADKNANFNEIIDGTPAVANLRTLTERTLKALVDHGTDLHVLLPQNRTLLYLLIDAQQPTPLIDSGADMDPIDFETEYESEIKILNFFVTDLEFNINHMDSLGLTPLNYAISNKKYRIAEVLLRLNAEPNLVGSDLVLPPLARISSTNYYAMINQLLNAGADPNQRTFMKDRTMIITPFIEILSQKSSYSEVYINYLKNGAKIDDLDPQGNSVLHVTSDSNILDIIRDKNYTYAQLQNVHGETPLFYNGLSKSSNSLINAGSDINHTSKMGLTPLHYAILNSDQDEFSCHLVDYDEIDLSKLDNMGRSVGHFTDRYALYAIEEAFLRKSKEEQDRIKNSFNNVDCFGKTALHHAIEAFEHGEPVATFVQNFGLDINPKTKFSPLHQALQLVGADGAESTAQFLIENGADVNCQMADGNTPLHILCGKYPRGKYIMVLLLKNGADVTLKNLQGISPIQIMPSIEYLTLPEFGTVRQVLRADDRPLSVDAEDL